MTRNLFVWFVLSGLTVTGLLGQGDRGTITGTANPTPGYRGMHSFTLAFDRYFVPADNLVGGESGLGKGFYLQMGGFAAGRLQTGGRATGGTGAGSHSRYSRASRSSTWAAWRSS